MDIGELNWKTLLGGGGAAEDDLVWASWVRSSVLVLACIISA